MRKNLPIFLVRVTSHVYLPKQQVVRGKALGIVGILQEETMRCRARRDKTSPTRGKYASSRAPPGAISVRHTAGANVHTHARTDDWFACS